MTMKSDKTHTKRVHIFNRTLFVFNNIFIDGTAEERDIVNSEVNVLA